jgi:hypothetical protein
MKKKITEKKKITLDSIFLIWSINRRSYNNLAVSYNSDSTSFTTNLTSLRIEITIIAVNNYDILELELQALEQVFAMSHIGITIIVRNSYNISYCNETLALPFSVTKIHAFLVNLQLNHDADHASFAPAGSLMTWSGKAYIDAITLIAIIKQAAIANILRQ